MVNDGGVFFIKVKYGNDIRKAQINRNEISRFDDLENFARATFDIDNDWSAELKYVDSDGDLITLTNDEDVRVALTTENRLYVHVFLNNDEFKSEFTKLMSKYSAPKDTMDKLNHLFEETISRFESPQKSTATNSSSMTSAVKTVESIATIHPTVHEEVDLNGVTHVISSEDQDELQVQERQASKSPEVPPHQHEYNPQQQPQAPYEQQQQQHYHQTPIQEHQQFRQTPQVPEQQQQFRPVSQEQQPQYGQNQPQQQQQQYDYLNQFAPPQSTTPANNTGTAAKGYFIPPPPVSEQQQPQQFNAPISKPNVPDARRFTPPVQSSTHQQFMAFGPPPGANGSAPSPQMHRQTPQSQQFYPPPPQFSAPPAANFSPSVVPPMFSDPGQRFKSFGAPPMPQQPHIAAPQPQYPPNTNQSQPNNFRMPPMSTPGMHDPSIPPPPMGGFQQQQHSLYGAPPPISQ